MKMPDILFSKKYSLVRVLESQDGVGNYIVKKVKDEEERLFLVNELTNREHIESYIGEFLALYEENKLEDFIEYFSENSKLYLVFRYYEGETLPKYLGKEGLALGYRVQLMKSILHKFLDYDELYPIICYTVLAPTNIILRNNIISFNYQLKIPPREYKKCVYEAIWQLENTLFLTHEIQKYSSLNRISDKCQKEIYHSIGEVLRDLEEVSKALDKDESLKNLLLAKKDKLMDRALKVFTVIIILAFLYVLYTKYLNNELGTALYSDVEAIGTVTISEEAKEGKRINTQETIYIDNAKKEQSIVTPPALEVKKETKIEKEKKEEPKEEEKTKEEELLTTYTVQKGDTLNGLCYRFYGNINFVDFVSTYNKMESKDLLHIGQEIKFPMVETIERGE